jgi:hypothetical protein
MSALHDSNGVVWVMSEGFTQPISRWQTKGLALSLPRVGRQVFPAPDSGIHERSLTTEPTKESTIWIKLHHGAEVKIKAQ